MADGASVLLFLDSMLAKKIADQICGDGNRVI